MGEWADYWYGDDSNEIVPPDVREWVMETYDAEGQRIWCRAFLKADEAGRYRMVLVARMDPMG